jgi:class 3 adenylate cyclase/tetratricopeptide (TPR) repeat protein
MTALTTKFCGECGAALLVPFSTSVFEAARIQNRDVVGGERRHLTVLFSDLVGSTAISARLDPEEFRELVADYHRATAEAINRFGGHVAKYLGDGIMAYFGWPEAYDNNAERAVRAGLAILDGMAALNARDVPSDRPKLAVRVGIDTGSVVIGKGGGSDSEVFGDAANIASRVQSSAEADTVFVTPTVNRLVAGLFVVEKRGSHQLKGVIAPIELYQIVRLSSVRNRLAASIVHGLTAFVGREDETRLLWSCWERASNGEGQVLLITGEAGIGKSRLVRQFRKRLAPTPHIWLECAGSPYFQNTPFYPIADMLQQGFAQRGDGSDAGKLRELERDLERAGLKPDEAVPLVAPMLNLPTDEKYPPSTLSSEEQRKRLMATLAAWLVGAVESVVMAVEDLHWFDASSLELMQLLTDQAATARVMLICTARPEFRAPWSSGAHHTNLTLTPLKTGDVHEMVASVLAQSMFSPEALAGLIERSGGVPLFVEEMTRAVLERGDGKLSAREIPATLHDSLMSRLDRLGRAKEVAQIAAVIGREFSYELLSAVSVMPDDALQAALLKLGDAQLIFARGVPPQADYTFRHALIQDTAYEALLKSRRRELHRRVAVAITEKFPQLAEMQLEVLARHWTDANETESAISAWRKAGDAAFDRYASREAEAAYRQGLDLRRAQPASRERDARELELMNRLVPLLQLTRGWAAPEAVEAVAHARELAEKSDNLAQLLLQVVGSFVSVLSRGDLDGASALATQLLGLAERDGSPAVLGLARVSEVTTCYFRGDLDAAEKHFIAGASLFVAAGAKFPSTVGSGFGFGSHVAWMLGHAVTAHDRIRLAIAGATELNSPFELAYAQYLAAMLHLFLREFNDAKISAAKSIELSDLHGFQQYAAGSRVFLGLAEAALGNPGHGMPIVNLGLQGLKESGVGIAMTPCLSWVAMVQSLNGKVTEALATIEESLVVNPAELCWRPDAIRVRGELRLKVGQTEAAEADFRGAIALAKKIGAKAWELRAAMSLTQILRNRRDSQQTRSLLAPLYSSFTEGFDTADLKDAKALLDDLAS